jgi:hypothetical protein
MSYYHASIITERTNMPTRTMDNKGVTLIENLVGIFLLSTLLIGIIGAYYLSLSTVNRGKHVAMANSILCSYMDLEAQAGYNGGSFDGSYYNTMPLSTLGFVNVTIDDRGTADTSDDIVGTLTCSPWAPLNVQDSLGNTLNFDGVRYKIVGFVLSWVEPTIGGQGQPFSVRTASYVCEH